ncbi:MAG TPA: hydrogenase maturation protease [Amycolatopsis sp.]|jgi:hydrogenase maturation protease|nr:hydrogenase maturation protease [Amycolatopsis sp.]
MVAVVIGIGNEYRHDDAIGPRIVAELERHALPGVRAIVADGEPTALLEMWTGADLAIVVDAVRCEPSTPGRIWRTTTDDLPVGSGVASSHALGIPGALQLGRALDRMPGELVIFAVEAADLDLGVGLSRSVAEALPHVVSAVLAELAAEHASGGAGC